MSIDDHLLTRESLERFKEAHPELDSVTKILSRYPVSENGDGEEGFIRDFADELDGGSREARQVYRMAANIQEKAALIWANISDAASPHFNQALFNNLPEDFLQQLQSIPGYNRLFGSLDYLECDHCRSIFSPAAYFVELMRFVETNITSKNKSTSECEDGIPDKCVLKYRRPDLYEMQLNYSNTNDLIPYIDLVNELLEVFIKNEETAEKDAYELVEDAVFPTSLPFNLPLEEIRSYLKQLGTSLYQIYKVFENLHDANTRSLTAREFLELSPKEFNLIKFENSSPSDLSEYYGDLPLTGENGLENVDLFLEQTRLTRQELNELIFQDLDRHELNAGLSRLFFVNNVDDGQGALGIFHDDEGYEKLLNLSLKKLDHIYRFVKLSRSLGWSFTDLDWSLRSLCESYIPEKVMMFDGINDYVTCPNAENLDLTQAFTIEAWINPTRSGRNAVVGTLIRDGSRQFHVFFGLGPSNELIFRVRKSIEDGTEFNTEFGLTSDRLVPLRVFTHVAVAVGGDNARLYINGQLDNEADIVGTPIDPTSSAQVNLNIGKDLYDEYFDGCIKDVRIWRSARGQAAIEDNIYCRFTGRENDLMGYWPLTEWNTLFDLTPNGNDGIMGGEEFVTQPNWVSKDLILDPLPDRGDGTGYQFNGVDQYLAARGVEYGEFDQMTLEAWVKVEGDGDNCIICMNDELENLDFVLWIDSSGKLTFDIGTISYQSVGSIESQQLTHVCIVLENSEIRIYIDGILDKTISLSSQVNFMLNERNLNIGRSFDDNYFNGVIKEVRLWNRARDQDQIALYMYRPVPSGEAGLIGYWRLDEVEDGIAEDLSYSQNHLYLGGIPEDYMPERRTTDRLEPESFQIPLDGTALQFDGDNDVIVIRNPKNWGLGKYERLTLELWFNPLDEDRSDERQVIFSQGDAEAGLNIYLYNDQLHVLSWKNNFEKTELQQSVFKTGPIEYGSWHHIAVTNDEFPTPSPLPADNVEFRAYLDGEALKMEGNSEVASGYRLSPVGPAYLGGLGQEGTTRFNDAYSEPDQEHLYFFAGRVADLRLWKTVKTAEEIEQDRHFAPEITEDLVAYFPMDEGEGWLVRDRASEQHENRHVGTLQKRNIALITKRTDTELVNVYSHYVDPDAADPGALGWKDYVYSGRMRITEENAAVGITFLSRHPENVDQYYALRRDGKDDTFHLVAHPLGVQNVKSSDADADKTDSEVVPDVDIWYRFLVEVMDENSRTTIKAKVWPETEAEPADYQIDAFDDSDIRIVSGTVGLWTSGASEGSRQFDNLRVWPASIPDPKLLDLLLNVNFEAKSQMPEPEKWSDTCDRLKPAGDEVLFKQVVVGSGGDVAFGTDSTDANIHSHYNPANLDIDVLGWKDYVYRGKMRMTDPEGGIGVTFLSRYPEDIDQYYALRRDGKDRTFHLVAHPHGVQSVSSDADKMDSGIEPEPNTWYHFLIELEDTGSRTEIRAKVWTEGDPEPSEFKIEAYDDSSIRLTSGTVGVWASDAGSKYFDNLRVYHDVLLSEDFDAYSENQDPECWRDTKSGYSNDEDDSIFKTFEVDGDKVFGTASIKNYIHSHYCGADARNWDSYVYTGKMRINDLGGGIGVTFFSQYFKYIGNYRRYYRLGYDPYGPYDDGSMRHNFYLSPHPPYGVPPMKGRYLTDVSPVPNTWYRFLIEVEGTGTQTKILAKIWPESETEPPEFQIEAYDDGGDRLNSGTVGVWAYGRGSKYFDDLEVVGEVLLSEMLGSEYWKEVGSRNRHEKDDSLFKTVDTLNNDLRWKAIEDDYPVILRPLSRTALELDGQMKYLATEAEGLELFQLTAEAWVNLSKIKESPILSLVAGYPDGSKAALIFGIDASGHLKLERVPGTELAVGTVSVGVGEFVHVAVRLEEGNVTFFVSGDAEELTPSQSDSLNLKIESLEIGRDFDGHYFEGEVKEVRIWKTARSSDEISSWIYRRPVVSDDLVGYWSLGEDEGIVATDASTNKNHMRLGGLVSARRPELVDLDEPDLGFWRPERNVLDFSGTSHIVTFNGDNEGAVCQRRAVEVWFRVEDKTISHRKQVIYQEGDNERGLNIYVYDGSLYLGGYNINESQWEGTWLHTDRIESCRWHHATLALDGRGEVRDESLQAFLDGKFVDEGPASQLWEHKNSFRLGGAIDQFRFHDEEVYDAEAEIPSDHHFRGQILDLRVWNTIRTLDQITENLYRLPTDGGEPSLKDEPGLYLWWQFDEAVDSQIQDLSGHGHVAEFANGQLKPIQLPPENRLPSASLDELVLDGIAAIKNLKEGHRWSVDRLCALWYSIKHFGKEDQTVLFDKIFNPEGSVIERWDCYLDQPIRWDKTGVEDRERDRKIRSRLMGALRVSHDDLNAIVEHLSREDEKIIDLDHLYLDQMYRLAQLAGILHLGVSDLLELLSLVDKSTPHTPQEVVELEEFVQWMKSAGLKVGDLVFITHDPDDLGGSVSFFKEADVLDLADDLIDRAENLLIKGDSFRADQISPAESVDVFDFLRGEGLISEVVNEKSEVIGGAVTPKYSETFDLALLLPGLAEGHNWIGEFDALKSEFDQFRSQLGDEIIGRLIDHNFIDSDGLVLDKPEGYGPDSLEAILEGASYPQNILVKIKEKLPRVSEVLELRKSIQDEILSKEGPVHIALQKAGDDQKNAVISGVAGLFDVQPDLTSVFFDSFRDKGGMEASEMLIELNDVHESRSISDALAAYLAKLSKVLHLADLLGLAVAEVGALLEDPEIFSLSDVLRPTLQELHDLFGFKQLQAAFEDAEGKLIELLSLEADDSDAILKAIDDLAGWEPRQVESLVRHFGSIQYNRIADLSRMKACFDLTRSPQVDIDFMIQLADTSLLGTDEEFGFYSQKAALLLEVLRAKYTDEEWPKVYKPIRDQLAVQRRDALLSLAMLKLKLDPEYEGRKDPDIFHQYFLLDFQVGSEVDTSRIVQGTASLQLYVQRCLMNLERGVDPATIPTEEWEWVKNYRVWEANRKVFLYPENYIEPDLRDTKTPIFEELEQELLQSEITQESAEAAFTHYLEKFAEVADLKIVGSYLHTDVTDVRSANPAERDEVLYLVGRTDKDPRIYYLREHVKDEFGARWLPWKKIDLAINSDFATPVYAFGKLFLFWTEFTKLTKSVDRKLSDRILEDYGADFLSKVFTDPISEDDIEKIKTLNIKINEVEADGFSLVERHDLVNLLPRTGHYSYIYWRFNYMDNYYLTGGFVTDLPELRNCVQEAYYEIILYYNAKRELEAELSPECIEKLQDGTWEIDDEEGYLLITERDQRVQETIYVYNTAVKYSYLNFNNVWIQPQTYAELGNELTESMHRESRWQRVYAQQVMEFEPEYVFRWGEVPGNDDEILREFLTKKFGYDWVESANIEKTDSGNTIEVSTQEDSLILCLNDEKTEVILKIEGVRTYEFMAKMKKSELTIYDQPQPKEENDAEVLQIDERTQLNKVIAKFDMSELTLEFWTKFINSVTGFPGWLDSITEEDIGSLQKSVRLIDYDNGNFNVTSTNKITISQAYEAATETADLIEVAYDSVEDAQNPGSDKQRLYQVAANKAEQARNRADQASFADSANVALLAENAKIAAENAMNKISEASATRQDATDTRQAAIVARQAATEAREWANEPGLDPEEIERREQEATRLEDEATRLEELATELEDEATLLEAEALNKVTEARDAAEDAVKNTPKWESNAVTLTVQLWGDELTTDLDYDTWQHIAIIFGGSDDGGYAVSLHKNGAETPVPGSLTGQRLPPQKSLVIGNQEADVATVFIAQMSEFRLWNHVRDIDAINNELNYRKTGEEEGLFYLPLNVREPNSIMKLVASEGFNFIIPVFKGELLERIAERERIILFYGDQIASLRNNLKDKSFDITLEPKLQDIWDVDLSYYQDSENLPKAALRLKVTWGLKINDFVSGEDEAVLAPMQNIDTYPTIYLLGELVKEESSFADVNNQPGWYIVDVGDEQFLVKAKFSKSNGDLLHMPTMAEISKVNYGGADKASSPLPLSISYELEDGDALFVSRWPLTPSTKVFTFERLNTYSVYELSESLFTGGIDKLLSLGSQHSKEMNFWEEYGTNTDLIPPALNNIPNEIDFQEGAYRLYFEEIFFHVPFLIANKLNSNQNFADSQRWYHYIFNPTSSGKDDDLDRYWRYLPFRGRNLDSLFELLTDSEALSAYRKDPFDPHAIAALRLNAYQKAVVMKYIDNLLDWGDSLFMQSTRESITEALMLYVLAYDLLGPRPKSKIIKRFEEMGTYEEFIREYENCTDEVIPEFFTEIEKENSTCATPAPHSNIITDFCVPENAKFIGYWDRVEDRLFKIRHSLNIEGVFRQLALFEPPIEPMDLVRAIAGGASISGALSALNVPVPHYRYSFMLGTAKDMTSNVMELGSALLGAIESRDAEKLAILQNTHERAILNLTTSIKKKEIDLAQEAIEALEISKNSPEYRKEWYQERINEFMNGEEVAELVLVGVAQGVKSTGAALKAISAATAGIPHVTTGAAGVASSPLTVTTVGGRTISKPLGYASEVLGIIADILNTTASMTAKMGGYKRRKAGWEYEKSLAEKELEEIEKQIASAQIQLAIARQELAVHTKTIQQNQEIEQFYRSKFSNQALYNWMVGRLSGLYFQAYKLAYDMAKSAEKALQYELPTNETYITPGHWDSLKKGLLAGESLMLELNRMEKSHLDQDSRFQEIEKTISMKKTFPGSLFLLVASGACEFRLSEELFDRDYPGHYFRVIKSIEIEVKTSRSMQPYESLNSTLIQLGNKTLIDPDIGGASYLLDLGSEQPISNTLRVNWRANQQVAISRVNEKDDGMFVLDFFWDDRYFPFEGTGAVSSWRLEIPKENNPDFVENNVLLIEDVLIHLRYTAKYDRGAFRKEVESLLRDLEEARS